MDNAVGKTTKALSANGRKLRTVHDSRCQCALSSLVLKGQYVLIAIIKSQVLLQHRCSSNCAIKFRDVINLVSFHLAKISPYNAALNLKKG